jgi:hypothetical protein
VTPLRHADVVTQNPSPEQPTLGLDGYEPPLQLRLSERTRKLGLKHIALIRQQLAEQAARTANETTAA